MDRPTEIIDAIASLSDEEQLELIAFMWLFSRAPESLQHDAVVRVDEFLKSENASKGELVALLRALRDAVPGKLPASVSAGRSTSFLLLR